MSVRHQVADERVEILPVQLVERPSGTCREAGQEDEIARLEKQMADPKSKPKTAEVPPTPEVMRLQGMLKSAETELALTKTDEQRLRKSMDSYQARIDETPKNEQEFQELTRNYETTKDLYQNLTRRFEEAQLAESMEQRQKGEQFKILDSAVPAASPTAPRRDRRLSQARRASRR